MTPTPKPPSRMRGKRKPKLPPSVCPWPVAVLAIDTATNSGWALFERGAHRMSGECNINDVQTVRDIVRKATGEDGYGRRDAVLVLEKPWGGPRNNVATLVALGRAQQAWLSAWRENGGRSTRVVKVAPQTWRSKVLGFARGRFLHEAEISRAAVEIGAASLAHEPDRCAAILIGKWATHAAEVGKVLPKRLRDTARAGAGGTNG